MKAKGDEEAFLRHLERQKSEAATSLGGTSPGPRRRGEDEASYHLDLHRSLPVAVIYWFAMRPSRLSSSADPKKAAAEQRKNRGAASHPSRSPTRVFTKTETTGSAQQRLHGYWQEIIRCWHRARGRQLPLHHPSSGKHKPSKAWHVDIPKRMMCYTLSIFLIFPLILFTWKETHPHVEAVMEMAKSDPSQSHKSHHEVYPNWFSDQAVPMVDDEERPDAIEGEIREDEGGDLNSTLADEVDLLVPPPPPLDYYANETKADEDPLGDDAYKNSPVVVRDEADAVVRRRQ